MKLPFTRSWYIFALAVAGFLAALTWANVVFLSPQFTTKSTFIAPYAAARAFVVEGLNPYSDEAAKKAQSLMRKATSSRGPRAPQLMLPFFGILLYVPFGLIPDLSIAFSVWMTFLELIVVAIPYLVWRLTGWDAPVWVIAVFYATSLPSLLTLQPFLTGSVVIPVVCLLLCGILALLSGYDEAAGILLALTAIKPTFVWLVLLFLFWWAFHQRRWQFFFWYLSSLAIFIALSFILVPDWLLQFLRSIYHALEISPLRFNFSAILSGARAGEARLIWIVFGIFTVLFFYEFVHAQNAENKRFFWALSLTIAFSQLLNFENNSEHLIVLILPAVVILSTFEERLGKRGHIAVTGAMLLFCIGIWLMVSIPILQNGGGMMDVVTDIPRWFMIWLPTLTLAGLYWIRWWINHPLNTTLTTLPPKPRR